MTPATPEELAELNRLLHPASPPVFAVAVKAAKVHADTVAGRQTTEKLGRYCHTALPTLLRRLLAVESDLATLRAAIARHVAADDQGDDPTPGELLEDLRRRGIDLRADVAEAAAVLEAEQRAAAFF